VVGRGHQRRQLGERVDRDQTDCATDSPVHATRSIIQTGIAAVCESSLAQSEVATMTHAARNEFSDSAADASIMDRAFLSVVGRM
jgi:hypothetical protein